MPGRIPSDCPHDLRPGVTVCLHCRYARRIARRNRLLRMGLRVTSGVVAVGLATLGVTRGTQLLFGQTQNAAPAEVSSPATVVASLPSEPVVARPVLAAAPAPAPVAPVIPVGRTELGEGLYAERTGDEVVVHFDTPATRTRRRDKFETIVRRTLPEVFGATAESLLANIPAGALSDGADLLTDIVASGVTLEGSEGLKVQLRPGTRPGQDGPLVVRYAVRIAH